MQQRKEGSWVSVIQWSEEDDIARAIYHELTELGYPSRCFRAGTSLPDDTQIVFSFAPYGKFFPLVEALERMPRAERPLLAHWNTEGVPDLRLPWAFTRLVAGGRAWLDRTRYRLDERLANGSDRNSFSFLDSRMLRFRYVGDYYYAYRRGILNVLADSSVIYSHLHNSHGLPTLFAPWGSSPTWYRELNLERDIDVLWMGNLASRRRRKLIENVREQLRKQGVEMYMADNVENPFIFGEERIRMLNRAKITLNVTRTWFDDNFSRFALAIPNRSLIVSEKLLPHCPAYQPGYHYAAAAPEKLADTVLYYLEHPAERQRLVQNAYCLATSRLTFKSTIKQIMQEVERVRQTSRA
jgi:hypothetical protein